MTPAASVSSPCGQPAGGLARGAHGELQAVSTCADSCAFSQRHRGARFATFRSRARGKIFKLAGLGPARLQAAAQPGQLVVSERVYEAVQERFEHAVPVDLELKGKAAPVPAWIIAARSMKETAGTAV